jgi:hypothetical protein
MGLLPHVIESTSRRMTPDEVLHVGEGGRPREVARETITGETRKRESARELKEWRKQPQKSSAFRGQTRGEIYSSQCHKQ